MTKDDYNWQRYWLPLGEQLQVAESGFPYEPDENWLGANEKLQRLDDIANVPCLILIGEAYLGKSTTISDYATRLEVELQGTPDAVKVVDINLCDDAHFLEEKIFRDPAFVAWLSGEHTLHLFIDSLDECLLRVDTVLAVIAQNLKKTGVKRLYLRLVSRPGYWQSELKASLVKLWPEQNAVMEFELSPLLERDVRLAAQTEEINPDAFLTAIHEREVVDFAIMPETLKMMLGSYDNGLQMLPASRSELYGQFCHKLCAESTTARSKSLERMGLSVEQVYVAAKRLAAQTLFGGIEAIWIDLARPNLPPRTHSISDFVGRPEAWQGGELQITELLLRHVLQTGLFTAVGVGRQFWSRRSSHEYLASQYLLTHELSLDKLLTLITAPGDASGKIIPQLYETVGWLAGASNQVFAYILERDPIVLLMSDLAVSKETDRAKLVKNVLEAFANEKLMDPDLSIRKRYSKLDHPKLAAQLSDYLNDKSKGLVARRQVGDIAKACKVDNLLDDLISVSLDPTDDHQVRTNCALAVLAYGSESHKARLKPLSMGQAGEDPDDELKGVGLRACWPDHMSASELFLTLTPPKEESLFGMYSSFLNRDIAVGLTVAELPIALHWAASSSKANFESRFLDGIISAIVLQAWENLEDSHVREALARFIVKRARDHEPIVTRQAIPRWQDIIANDESGRRSMFKTLLSLTVSQKAPPFISMLIANNILVNAGDIPWLLQLLKRRRSPRIRHELITAILRLYARFNAHFDGIYEAAEVAADLREALEPYRTVVVKSEQAALLREHYEISTHDNVPKPIVTPSPPERIRALLDKADSGSATPWWQLNREMTLVEDSSHYGDEFISDLTKLPGWQTADEVTRNRIVALAKRYVVEEDPDSSRWLGTNTIWRPALAGYRALALLQRTDSEFINRLASDIWKRWSPIIVSFPDHYSNRDPVIGRQLLELAVSHAPSSVTDAIIILIDAANKANDSIFVLGRLDGLWWPELGDALLIKLNDLKMRSGLVGQILNEFLQRNVPEGRTFVKEVIAKRGSPESRELAVVAARCLVAVAGDDDWTTLWQVFNDDADFGKDVILDAVYILDRNERTIQERIPEDRVADLYIWLARQFPHSEDPSEEGFHTVEPREAVADWRNKLLQTLVNKGTWESVRAVRRIAFELPNLGWLKYSVERAEIHTRQLQWAPITPEDLIEYVSDKYKRLVSSGIQLMDVVQEGLMDLEKSLQGIPPASQFLWDRVEGYCRPKDEAAFSDYVVVHLTNYLRGRKLVINREVEVNRVNVKGIGERIDIKIDAVPKDKKFSQSEVISVMVEVKGCWYRQLYRRVSTQLYARYLKDKNIDHGIYLVGWFNHPAWDLKRDLRRNIAMSRSIPEVLERINNEIDASVPPDKSIRCVIVNAALPTEADYN